jgi:hypothetical protein
MPPDENGWQGGPPTRRSGDGSFLKSTSSMETVFSGHRGLFFKRVEEAIRSFSTKSICEKPDISTPSARPPAPEKISTDFIVAIENIHLSKEMVNQAV